ncbi:hypothetical protein ACTXT7_006486 [Hymenolepis weldensis]
MSVARPLLMKRFWSTDGQDELWSSIFVRLDDVDKPNLAAESLVCLEMSYSRRHPHRPYQYAAHAAGPDILAKTIIGPVLD